MKEHKKQQKFLDFVDEAYNQPIGDLCDRINKSDGNGTQPLLHSILCERLNIDEVDFEFEPNVKVKKKKRENYHKHRRS